MNFKALASHGFVFVYMREFDNYILFGACQNNGNHCETTKIINVLSGTQLTVLSNKDGLGCLGSFKTMLN